MADCVGVGLLRNFRFCNFAKFSRNFYFRVSQNFPRISRTTNQNLGEIFATSQNTKPKLGAQFCYFGRINSLDRTYSYAMSCQLSHLISREGSDLTSVPCPKPPHTPPLHQFINECIFYFCRRKRIIVSENFVFMRKHLS